MKKNLPFFAVLAMSLGLTGFAQSISRTISYQGRLAGADGFAAADGEYAMSFSLYREAIEGTALWTEAKTVTVTGGLFQQWHPFRPGSLGAIYGAPSLDFGHP